VIVKRREVLLGVPLIEAPQVANPYRVTASISEANVKPLSASKTIVNASHPSFFIVTKLYSVTD